MMKPITAITAKISRPIIIMLASSAPKPKCEASAARPSPAARPASGPIHERPGWAAGVGAAGVAGAAEGARGAAAGGAERCMPNDLPPPRRAASASLIEIVARPNVRTTANSVSAFIEVTCKNEGIARASLAVRQYKEKQNYL
jgi:hypothetical protein